jgi:kynurenine/2-aminoadipate aminotransferase
MDEDGRVIRFDSFSKIISSGLRLGFVTGPKDIIEKIQLSQQTSVLHVSGISQAILYTLLDSWGKSGFEEHLLLVQQEYTKRRDTLVTFAEKYLR